MKISQIMSREVRTCHPDTNLAAAAAEMWVADCGALPVVDAEGRAVGMITDRDICMAVATRHRLASEIRVAEVIGGDVFVCEAEDDVKGAIEVMEKRRVRRLPVIDEENRVIGIVSMNDIILSSVERKAGGAAEKWELSYENAMAAMKMICAHGTQRPAASKRRRSGASDAAAIPAARVNGAA